MGQVNFACDEATALSAADTELCVAARLFSVPSMALLPSSGCANNGINEHPLSIEKPRSERALERAGDPVRTGVQSQLLSADLWRGMFAQKLIQAVRECLAIARIQWRGAAGRDTAAA